MLDWVLGFMVVVWADGVKFLFSGDMGPHHTPVLCHPAQHREADMVLVESTYGPGPGEKVSFDEFGRQIMKVVAAGGSILLPAFVLHKTQMLLYVIHKLKDDRIIDRDMTVFAYSSTVARRQCRRRSSRPGSDDRRIRRGRDRSKDSCVAE